MEGHFAVTVPPGAAPGSQLNVRAPTGETLTVVIPAGIYPGSSFMVPLPRQPRPVQAQVVQSPQPKVYQVNIASTRPAQPVYAEQVQSPRPVPPSSPAGTFPVIVPAGHGPGMRLSVRAPNTGKMMTVVIPAGVGPGGQFAVPLPMPVASYGTRSRPTGNAAARRQYQAARRRGDGKLHKVHWGVGAGIAVIIILLILLLSLGGDGGNQGSGHNTPGYCKESATSCLASWTDPTINGCGTTQEYCTNCDDSYHWCCTTNNCEGDDGDGWCKCNAGAPPKQAASGECLSGGRTCMASWTDASSGGTCGSQQTACSADSSGNACDGDSPWCCLDEECDGEGSGWCYCKP